MKPGQIIGSGITASAVAHLSVLLLLLLYTEVHPFAATPTESIAVDVVTPEELAKQKPEPEPVPVPKLPATDVFEDSAKSAAAAPPSPAAATPSSAAAPPPAPAAPPAAATPPLKPPAPVAERPNRQQAKAEPPPTPSPPPPAAQSPPPAAQSPPPPAPAAPTYAAPQPDLSVKYHVVLGLPMDAPPQNRPTDAFDAPASAAADVGTDIVAQFRRHLKTCAKLPASIGHSDKLTIKLRVLLTPEGRLAAQPALIEASASAKGPALMQGAISALEACQPYGMLPADKYREWKVLDLVFTPEDFGGAS